MGMSTYIRGFKPPDKKWEAMKKIYDACQEAEMEIPDEVQEYFNYEEPDEAGVEVEIETKEYANDDQEGLEVDLDKIPKGVMTIRFTNSW